MTDFVKAVDDFETACYTLGDRGIIDVGADHMPADLLKQHEIAMTALMAFAPIPEAATPSEEPVAQLNIGEFKPCIAVNEELSITEAIFEDVSYIAEPVFSSVYHYIDKHIAVEDGRLVGMTVWSASPVASPAVAPVAVSVKRLIERLRDVAGPVRLNNGCFADLAFEAAEALSSITPATKGGEDVGAAEQPEFTYYECPECGFDVIHNADYEPRSTACPICAGDSGHDVGMRSRTARATDKPEGKDARPALSAQDTDGEAKS